MADTKTKENNTQQLELPLLVTRDTILFPETVQSITVSRKISSQAIFYSKSYHDSLIFIAAQNNRDISDVKAEDIYNYGSLCRITSFNQDKRLFIIRVQAKVKVKLNDIYLKDGSFYAMGEILEMDKLPSDQEQRYTEELKSLGEMSGAMDSFRHNASIAPNVLNNFYGVCYTYAQHTVMPLEDKLLALKTTSSEELYQFAKKASEIMAQNKKTEGDVNDDIRKSSEASQRDYFLRERLKAIRSELNNGEDGPEERVDVVKKRLDNGHYPDSVRKRIENECKKAESMPGGSLEASLIQNYVDVLLDLPWWQKTEDNDDIDNVKKILDEDHYGLQKVKKRIIEYLAVKKLTGNLKSPILCFFGPPGCGKTSLGRSIARALDRKFIKASLGGVSDEGEIRGHRRTYVGSMPGRIVNGMKKVGVTNPVFLLDEIDKLSQTNKGDPASALLEVLDPEQNNAFNDNYIEEPYDLSDVLFICTANNLENIPGPLRDRLELIEVNSYTLIEKTEIAKRHLLAKELHANGLDGKDVTFTDDAITTIIDEYTREAGVRELERKIAACLRRVAVDIVSKSKKKKIVIDSNMVKEYLGMGIIDSTKKESEPQVGVVTGLAYSDYGGAILQIEVTHFPGRGGLVLTGKLGDVMKESATIALDYVRANATKYGIDPEIFKNDDVHIHVPEGAIPKDGPSAGCAITTAIISCLSKTPVNPNVAMTGEVTLRGHALAIGGLREKSLAALRAGIKTIIVPAQNANSIAELPDEIKNNLEVIYMNNVDDALKIALVK